MRSVLVISYWFAPSPAVGAKRFSFLAREFARQGYDVHVITQPAGEWRDMKSDVSLPLSGKVHGVPEPVKLPLAGPGLARRAANSLLRRLLSPVGWEISWAGAAARKAVEVGARLPP